MIFPTLMPGFGIYAGRNYVLANGVPATGDDLSFYVGASPAVAKEDYGVFLPTTAPDDFVLEVDNAGVPLIHSMGSDARQSIVMDVYDTSLRRWYGPATEYVNNHAPVLAGTPTYTSLYTVNAPIANFDVAALATDPESDGMVVTTVDDLPDGLSLTGNTVTGTPTAVGTFVVNFVISDLIGASYNLAPWTFTVISVNAIARWTDYPRVRRFPAVRAAYDEQEFEDAVYNALREGDAWTRRNPTAVTGDFGIQIDTYNIPRVRALTVDGTYANS